MTTRSVIALAAVLGLGLAGCRSDGGIGRRDSCHSNEWTMERVQVRHAHDVETTRANFEALPEWIAGGLESPADAWGETLHLYLEGGSSQSSFKGRGRE